MTYNIDPNAVSERIRFLISHYEMTNVAFCEKCGIPATTISNILNGKTKVTIDVLNKISSSFNELSHNWFYFGVGDPFMGASGDDPSSVGSDNSALGLFPTESEQVAAASNKVDLFSDSQDQLHYSAKDLLHPAQVVHVHEPARKVEKIMVFYSDNSYETFLPSSELSK